MASGVQISGGLPTPDKVHQAHLTAAERRFKRAATLVEGEIRKRAPVRTGTLRRSITVMVQHSGTRFTAFVGTATRYAPWLEFGTGIYGPRKTPIVPVRARALRFPAGGGPGTAGPGFTLAGRRRTGTGGTAANYVFAKSVKGIKPLHFFQDGIRIAQPKVLNELQMISTDARRALGMGA